MNDLKWKSDKKKSLYLADILLFKDIFRDAFFNKCHFFCLVAFGWFKADDLILLHRVHPAPRSLQLIFYPLTWL